MLSYRHSFHAGNHGDVLKHLVLHETLSYLNQKPKPWSYVDTHAGAGSYDLSAAMASKKHEANGGIGRLRGQTDLPAALAGLLAAVGKDPEYPGSPLLAARLARNEDRLWLYELHSSDFKVLNTLFSHDRRVRCAATDGFAGLRAQWPPVSRRGLALIDPSYELPSDYAAVTGALRDGLKRFATGIMLIWFPLLPKHAAQLFPGKLQKACTRPWLQATLQVCSPSQNGFGLYGSGVFVVNPPFKLASTLRQCLPVLEHLLALDDSAGHALIESA